MGGDNIKSLEVSMKKYFINVTNHPLVRWRVEQLEAAKHFHEELILTVDEDVSENIIIDIPFPDVPASADMNDIRRMAEELVSTIMKYEKPFEKIISGVLIQGEMTLTFATVSLLNDYEVWSVAACSERSVKEKILPDGSTEKISVFNFVQFRPYDYN